MNDRVLIIQYIYGDYLGLGKYHNRVEPTLNGRSIAFRPSPCNILTLPLAHLWRLNLFFSKKFLIALLFIHEMGRATSQERTRSFRIVFAEYHQTSKNKSLKRFSCIPEQSNYTGFNALNPSQKKVHYPSLCDALITLYLRQTRCGHSLTNQ